MTINTNAPNPLLANATVPKPVASPAPATDNTPAPDISGGAPASQSGGLVSSQPPVTPIPKPRGTMGAILFNILGALGHAANIAHQVVPDVAAAMPADTPIGGAMRQAGQTVLAEREQRQQQQQQQQQMGIEQQNLDIRKQNLALLRAKTLADIHSMSIGDAAKQAQVFMNLQSLYKTLPIGTKDLSINGQPTPTFPTLDKAEEFAREHASSIIPNDHALALPAGDGSWHLVEVPNDANWTMEIAGQKVSIPATQSNIPEILSYSAEQMREKELAATLGMRADELKLNVAKTAEQIRKDEADIRQGDLRNVISLRGETTAQYIASQRGLESRASDLMKSQTDLRTIQNILLQPAKSFTATIIAGVRVDSYDDVKKLQSQLQKQIEQQTDEYNRFQKEIYVPSEQNFLQLMGSDAGSPSPQAHYKVGDVEMYNGKPYKFDGKQFVLAPNAVQVSH